MLLALFSFKIGKTFSALTQDKTPVVLKWYIDAESEQGEEEKTEKQTAFEHLTMSEHANFCVIGKDAKVQMLRWRFFYQIDHFSTVPSPPPDCIA